ncbi:MAG TPA: hypothetical protein VFZ82_21160, partial [Methylomirabilota bacterium]|nr:hypothetical protein [Methylomirabilota bacterium]
MSEVMRLDPKTLAILPYQVSPGPDESLRVCGDPLHRVVPHQRLIIMMKVEMVGQSDEQIQVDESRQRLIEQPDPLETRPLHHGSLKADARELVVESLLGYQDAPAYVRRPPVARASIRVDPDHVAV